MYRRASQFHLCVFHQVISVREAALLFWNLHHLRFTVLRLGRNPDPAGSGTVQPQVGSGGGPQHPRGSRRPYM